MLRRIAAVPSFPNLRVSGGGVGGVNTSGSITTSTGTIALRSLARLCPRARPLSTRSTVATRTPPPAASTTTATRRRPRNQEIQSTTGKILLVQASSSSSSSSPAPAPASSQSSSQQPPPAPPTRKHGVLSLREALAHPPSKDSTLVQVGATTMQSAGTKDKIPVCRWLCADELAADERQWAERQIELARSASSMSSSSSTASSSSSPSTASPTTSSSSSSKEKEIRLNSNIAEHDLRVRMRKIRELLARGHPVKVVLSVVKAPFRLHAPTPHDQAALLQRIQQAFTAKPPKRKIAAVMPSSVEPSPSSSSMSSSMSSSSLDTAELPPAKGCAHQQDDSDHHYHPDHHHSDKADDSSSTWYAMGARLSVPVRQFRHNTWLMVLTPNKSDQQGGVRGGVSSGSGGRKEK